MVNGSLVPWPELRIFCSSSRDRYGTPWRSSVLKSKPWVWRKLNAISNAISTARGPHSVSGEVPTTGLQRENSVNTKACGFYSWTNEYVYLWTMSVITWRDRDMMVETYWWCDISVYYYGGLSATVTSLTTLGNTHYAPYSTRQDITRPAAPDMFPLFPLDCYNTLAMSDFPATDLTAVSTHPLPCLALKTQSQTPQTWTSSDARWSLAAEPQSFSKWPAWFLALL